MAPRRTVANSDPSNGREDSQKDRKIVRISKLLSTAKNSVLFLRYPGVAPRGILPTLSPMP